jgi:type II secretory pathway pseudopilin PulG
MNIKVYARHAKAFTIVEVMMSTIIIGIAAAGLLACFHGSFLIMRFARENQRATQVLVERAEALRVFNWTQVTNGSIPPFTNDFYSYTSNNTQGPGPTYSVAVALVPLTSLAATYQTNMFEVDITVQWTNSMDNIPHTRVLSTYVARDGIQNYVY